MQNHGQIVTKLNGIEAEIEEIKLMVASSMKPKNTISLRGMAKPLVPENELDKHIEKAKLSLEGRHRSHSMGSSSMPAH